MDRRLARLAVCGFLLAGFIVGGMSPASANLAPADPASADLVAPDLVYGDLPVPAKEVLIEDLESIVPQEPPTPGPTGFCQSKWNYSIYRNTSNDMRVIQRRFITNNTGSTATGTFTASESGTVTMGASVTLTTEVKALIFGKVQASVNASVERSMTANVGVSVSVSIKPHTTVYGDYGIWRENVQIKKYYTNTACAESQISYFTYYAPYRVGWRVY